MKELNKQPKAEVRSLMVEACKYASTKLAEVETRSRLVAEIHG